MRHFRLALLVLLLLFVSGTATAADNAEELSGLYDALNVLNQQQQSIYQQFQMVQELRRSAVPLYGTAAIPQFHAAPPNYDDVVAAQNSAIRRDENLMQQADQLLETYNHIEEQKKPILQRIYSLSVGE